MSESMSYPPMLRKPIDKCNSSVTPEKTINEIDSIPIVDFERLGLDDLHDACKHWGLFRLVNHGVPLHLMTQLHEHARNLFSLSFESKKELPVSYFWGTPALTPSGSALNGSVQNVNWLEGFNFPVTQLSHIDAQNPTLNDFRYCMLR